MPARSHRGETSVRRSRFVALLAPAPDPAAAHAFVQSVREELPDATHHCWAFVAGPPGDTARIGMGDAGEPHGTAGRPMLNVLLGSGVGEVVAVVARYFGGVELGKGGLARAYGGAVAEALETLPRARRVKRIRVRVEADYAAVDGLLHLMESLGVVRLEEGYGARVRFLAAVPEGRLEAFRQGVAGVTGGKGRVEAEG